MKSRLLCLSALLLGALAGWAAPMAPKGWEQSIVSLDVTTKEYDYFQPWSRRSQSVTKAGVIVGPREILTTADEFTDRTLVRVQKGGRGQWWAADVKWVDYPANLALVTCADEKFWAGLKPVALADKIIRNGNLQIIRWRQGTLETRKAEFSRFLVAHANMSDAVHVQMQLSSEIDGTGWSEPVIVGSRVVGLIFSQSGNSIRVLPSLLIRSILDAQKKGRYRGLGYFDFTWQPTENPETHEFLKQPDEPRGVVVIDVPAKPGAEPVLKPRDLLLQVDGFDIDIQGDYVDPDYGHLMLENLATRNKWAGDSVRIKVWREGRALDVTYRLPRAEDAARLVPEAPFDQAPEYVILGGLVFQPLTKNFLRSWGQDWERRAPFRLAFFRNEEPTPERPSLVILSQVLPDIYNLGYQDSRNLIVERVNGQKISQLTDVTKALARSQDGFHVFEFMKGDTLQRMVLDGKELKSATARVLQRYGIDSEQFIASLNRQPGLAPSRNDSAR